VTDGRQLQSSQYLHTVTSLGRFSAVKMRDVISLMKCYKNCGNHSQSVKAYLRQNANRFVIVCIFQCLQEDIVRCTLKYAFLGSGAICNNLTAQPLTFIGQVNTFHQNEVCPLQDVNESTHRKDWQLVLQSSCTQLCMTLRSQYSFPHKIICCVVIYF
jgi:hypothetical protein